MTRESETKADILVAGGGLGGVAAALAALRRGRSVLMVEETDWIGGQLTSQGVPPDEHTWIERFGCTRSYRGPRDAIRAYYRTWYPLTEEARARPDLNPGEGRVSRLCHEPKVAAAVVHAMVAPYVSAGRLRVLYGHRVVGATVDGDRVHAVTVESADGHRLEVTASYVLDATELGELLPAGKNIGTTHITNGCYRLHPVEWNIGEVAGALAAHCLEHGLEPEQVHADGARPAAFQGELAGDGVELAWPEIRGY